ncbi:MAG: hypothetical protein IPI32_05215 [Austwickia sp.]|nr:hypothetical protein [Austwickia sp.]MBK8437032.1 hypothetical protein [Austwickia sp.]MBK9100657.1 hypothetical protein [Austwickia sp.]
MSEESPRSWDGLDVGQLDQLVDVDGGSLLRGLVGRFPASLSMADEVETMVAAGDAAGARAVAHRLTGRLLNLGAIEPATTARAIVGHLDAGDLEPAAALLPQLHAALARAGEGLHRYLRTLPGA